ncbi:MAG TPA: sugar phosphate isomerase/epimerase [Planctomycetes bacterium]|nr:sugar phosphate isomerase/epimerase [Planctomycetota bacterium]
MLLGYNSNGLAHHRLDEAIEILAEAGFQVLALTPDICHLDPYRTGPEEWRGVRRLLDKHGMRCVIETGARFVLDPRAKHRPNLLEEDEGGRGRRLDFLNRCLELGSVLGAQVLSLWAGTLPPGVAPQEGLRRLGQGLEQLLEAAEPRGIRLALEPEPGMLIQTVAQAQDLLRGMGNPSGMGLCVDIGHLFITGEASPEAGTLEKVLKKAAPQLLQVHLEDIRGREHLHLPPGEGDIDFDRVWQALRSLPYHGPVCFELSRSSHEAPRQIQRIRSLFPRVFPGS